MKTIRCCFVDFWEGFSPSGLLILNAHYKIKIDYDKPDYVFFSCFGRRHYTYSDCVKIFISSENSEPNFNDCDYAISFSIVTYADRAIRYSFSDSFRYDPLLMISPEKLLNRKFCNFIYSNNFCSNPFRIQFFEKLSTYKKVDSGGPLLNNMGYCVPKGSYPKIQFQNQYKFSLAIENSSMSGYTTEKMEHPLWARSLPIYWGNPQVSSIFHPKSFVNLMDYASMEEAIEEIIRLDNDDEAYLEKVTAPFWLQGDSFEEYRQLEEERLLQFYDHIFNQPLDQAIRRTLYGWNKLYVKEQQLLRMPSASLSTRVFRRLKTLLNQ